MLARDTTRTRDEYKKIRLIFIALIASYSSLSIASYEHISWTCRLSARSNAAYAAFLDIKLQILKPDIDNASKDKQQEIFKKLFNEHESFKDKKYREIRDVVDDRVRLGTTSYLSGEIERTILEAGIDHAYVYAGENFLNDRLGKKEDHYYRMIFDKCIAGFYKRN